MTEHTTFIEKISLWLDNELSPAEIGELQAHLAECSACNHTYQAIQQVETLLLRASSVLVEPAPGFTTRFETRLAHYPPRSRWQLWLGLSGLLLGTLLFLTIGVVVGGITLLNLWATLLDVQIQYYWLGVLGETVNQIRTLLNLGGLFFKVLFIAMKEPIFWVSIPVAGGLAWLWLRLLKNPQQRLPTTLKMLI